MTYQAPDGWRLTPHGPQHAAPLGSGSRPLRIHAHRALRLFIVAGAWGAGLCLIIGSVALVAGAAGPDRAAHVAATAGNDHPGKGQLPGRGASSAPADRRVLATFSGTGNQTTSDFTVAAHSRWELQWSYRCAARSPLGHLVIREGNAGGNGVSVDAAGATGHGSAWTYSDVSAHYLVVITNCGWTVQLIGRP
jgi:hypothetical protein